MRSKLAVFAQCFAILGLVVVFSHERFAQAPTNTRRIRTVDNNALAVIHGNTHALARPEYDQGEVEDSFVLKHMTLAFKPSAAQQASLEKLESEQLDPKSPNYHKWLSPEQYGAQFGLGADDLQTVTAWLQNQGFSIDETARGSNWIAFSGYASQAKAAFHTEIHRYQINGETHYANASDPSVPAAFIDVVQAIRGLHNFRPKPRVRTVVRPRYTNGSNEFFLSPQDFATIYDLNPLYSAGLDGTGETLAVMGQTDIALSDINAFRAAAGLSANPPSVILNGPDPGTSSADLGEADLDLEWSGAIAKNATILYINSGTANGVFDSLTYAIDNKVAPVLSISYGGCESLEGQATVTSYDAEFAKGAMQGQTIIGPGGDEGATDCEAVNAKIAIYGLAVDFPASSPHVTGVGGTEFSADNGSGASTYWAATNNNYGESALSYIPETTWNDTTYSGIISAGGGGASIFFAKPSWQHGIGVPGDGHRDVPDVALTASADHDGYLLCSGGNCTSGFVSGPGTFTIAGGTSAATPTFAGIVTLVVQNTGSSQGLINPTLYTLAGKSTDAFHDITTGNNMEPCQKGTPDCPNGGNIGFSAGVGYDQATGLGSVDADKLVAEWSSVSGGGGPTPDFQLALSPSTGLSMAPGANGSATATIGALNGFTGTVTVTCGLSSGLANVTCTASPATVAKNGTVTVTVAASSGARLHRLGPFNDIGRGPGWLALGLILLAGLAGFTALRAGNRSQPAAWMTWMRIGLVETLLALTLVLISACGGGGSSSGGSGGGSTTGPAESGTMTVTGTSGTLTHSVSVSVSIT